MIDSLFSTVPGTIPGGCALPVCSLAFSCHSFARVSLRLPHLRFLVLSRFQNAAVNSSIAPQLEKSLSNLFEPPSVPLANCDPSPLVSIRMHLYKSGSQFYFNKHLIPTRADVSNSRFADPTVYSAAYIGNSRFSISLLYIPEFEPEINRLLLD